jgi:putative oxygen-independent coproporphyrinogen III oxidase
VAQLSRLSIDRPDPGVEVFGVYVHIPFCAHRCDYCDFATWTDKGDLVEAYVAACIADLAGRDLPLATSVFFGGGTPSLIPAADLGAILDAIPRAPGAEVTVECNPDTTSPELFATYVDHGVTRVSIGVQSMVSSVLGALGRTHDPANVAQAVADARAAGIDRINLDLIYGAAGESVDDWQATLDAALALDPEHISAYALTVEAGTPLDVRIRAGATTAPDDDEQAAKYAAAQETLAAADYEQYEISNWARREGACIHNLLYWRQQPYLGIGCAAHSHAAGIRWWNVRTPERYIDAITTGTSPVAGHEQLDAEGRAEEAFTLALRTTDGVHLAASGDVAAELAALVEADLVEIGCGKVRLTPAGRVLANDVTARLLALGAAPEVDDPGPVPAWAGLDVGASPPRR